MKKNYREITVNGETYAWSVRNNLDGDGSNFVKIWKLQEKGTNKDLIFDDIYNIRKITPKIIKELIEKNVGDKTKYVEI